MSSRDYPKVWSRFERTLSSGDVFNLEVGDIPESLWSAAVEFMLGNYIRDDVWWLTAGTAKDEEAIQEYRVLLTSIVQQKMSIGCFLIKPNGERSLVGVNMCLPQRKDVFVEHKPPKTKAGLLSLRMFAEGMKMVTIYDKYEVSEFLMGAGLSVAPQYRGLGIAVELLKARESLSKAAGFKATGGIFTSTPAQKAADKASWECLHTTTYTEFGTTCDIDFNTDTEFLKIYAIETL